MPPIPVHIDEPITPSKTQKTTQDNAATPSSASAGITTAATAVPPPAYPAAQPAVPAIPGPTPFAAAPRPPPTQTTQPAQNASPPPPQPGAVPAPPPTTTSTLPPPPKQGTPFTAALNNLHAPPAPAPAPSSSNPQGQNATTLNLGPAPPPPTTTTSHPTGYQQNLFAQELSPAQRASLDQQEETEWRGSFFAGLPGGNVGAGAGGSASEGGDAAGSVWNTVKGWASAAGNKAAEVEADVWRRYGGK